MKHLKGRRDGAPKNTFKSRLRVIVKDISIIIKFHKVAKANGWYRETTNKLRYVLGIHGIGKTSDKSTWLVSLIVDYLMPWVRGNITNEATQSGLLDCLDAMKIILMSNNHGGKRAVKLLITDYEGSND